MPTIKRTSDRPPWLGPKAKPFANSRKDVYHTTRWRKLAAWHKAHNPVCINFDVCGGPTEVSDHRIPLSQGGAPYALSNLDPMCHACHRVKTQAEAQQARGRGGSHL
jgi:5-methylcytosine-specific restriction endonuclease McrA